jgi:hypothetical protein
MIPLNPSPAAANFAFVCNLIDSWDPQEPPRDLYEMIYQILNGFKVR